MIAAMITFYLPHTSTNHTAMSLHLISLQTHGFSNRTYWFVFLLSLVPVATVHTNSDLCISQWIFVQNMFLVGCIICGLLSTYAYSWGVLSPYSQFNMRMRVIWDTYPKNTLFLMCSTLKKHLLCWSVVKGREQNSGLFCPIDRMFGLSYVFAHLLCACAVYFSKITWENFVLFSSG